MTVVHGLLWDSTEPGAFVKSQGLKIKVIVFWALREWIEALLGTDLV